MGFFAWLFAAPRKASRVAVPKGTVMPNAKSLVEQRGWKQGRHDLTGPYATRQGTWHGRIERAGSDLRVYIKHPPATLRRHPKWVCFHDAGGGWFQIHLATPPRDGDPNAVIAYVERLLTEARKIK